MLRVCPPPTLVFHDVLSRRTAYGLIWTGLYQNTYKCVIKMIMLTSGIHYDKNQKKYRSSDEKSISEKEIEPYFNHNDKKPFYHKDFRHRRSMTQKDFLREVDNYVSLGRVGLAPIVYGYGINESHEIHYGFIFMERVDCSLKDIFLHRDLHHSETKLITNLIDELHHKHGIIHGDLKPSNIGVYLNDKSIIQKACFFDCQKLRSKTEMNTNDFNRSATREADNFKRHITKNQLEGDNPKYIGKTG